MSNPEIIARLLITGGLLCCLLGATGCQQQAGLTGDAPHEIAECTTCHASPPSTGGHTFHLYQQSYRSAITCQECHASSIDTMFWSYRMIKSAEKVLGFADSLALPSADSITISVRHTILQRFSWCDASVRNDTLFGAAVDTFAAFVKVFPDSDSIVQSVGSIAHFPCTGTRDTVIIINLGPPFGMDTQSVTIKTFGPPGYFDRCSYAVRMDSLYQSVRTPFASVIKLLTNRDTVISQSRFNSIYVMSLDTVVDTALHFGVAMPESTTLKKLPLNNRLPNLTTLPGVEARVLISDSATYQISHDTLWRLQLDSLVTTGGSPFAGSGPAHANGVIDVSFLHETTTVYRAETLQVVVDSITGANIAAATRQTGSWRPDRKSCMSKGIESWGCHTRLNGKETFWYQTPAKE